MDINDIKLTEEVIRDGSYASEFKFQESELRELLRTLDGFSFIDLIDVGPGTGLGTKTPVPDPSLEDHLQIASETVTSAGLTTLVLPSIAVKNDLDLIGNYSNELDLVRIGVDADEISTATGFLTVCDEFGVNTSLNLLKTHRISPTEAVEAARIAANHGADIIYIVDSSGGFAPDDVRRYATRISEEVEIEIGFHGHNNLGYGLQNTIAAIESGVTHVDTSFQGIGRSAGNVQTELLCAQHQGDMPSHDWHRMFELEELLEDVYPDKKGVPVRDILYGLAKFHSSFEPNLRKLAEEQHFSFADLLIFAAENQLSTVEEIRAKCHLLQE